MRTKDKTMRKSLVAAIVMSTPGLVGSALAADLEATMPWKAPSAPPPFSWTSCYFGVHGGGVFASKDITDPVALVQDNVSPAPGTTGVTTAHVSPTGAVVGGQLGCDYQFAPHWVAGIEGAASGSTMKGSTTVNLPASGDQAVVSSRTDFLPSVTGRLGYAFDHTLLYGKAGIAWASSKHTVTGSLAGTPFDFEGFDTRGGWTAGAGAEWAFSRNWSVNLEYDFYSFGSSTALLTDSVSGSGPVDVKQNIQVVKLGLNFHMWSGW
jgi:outer membrane immunogenic protein